MSKELVAREYEFARQYFQKPFYFPTALTNAYLLTDLEVARVCIPADFLREDIEQSLLTGLVVAQAEWSGIPYRDLQRYAAFACHYETTRAPLLAATRITARLMVSPVDAADAGDIDRDHDLTTWLCRLIVRHGWRRERPSLALATTGPTRPLHAIGALAAGQNVHLDTEGNVIPAPASTALPDVAQATVIEATASPAPPKLRG
jgi:hypothetical protein